MSKNSKMSKKVTTTRLRKATMAGLVHTAPIDSDDADYKTAGLMSSTSAAFGGNSKTITTTPTPTTTTNAVSKGLLVFGSSIPVLAVVLAILAVLLILVVLVISLRMWMKRRAEARRPLEEGLAEAEEGAGEDKTAATGRLSNQQNGPRHPYPNVSHTPPSMEPVADNQSTRNAAAAESAGTQDEEADMKTESRKTIPSEPTSSSEPKKKKKKQTGKLHKKKKAPVDEEEEEGPVDE